MKIEVSLGEAIDKYSILEIKLKYITDIKKKTEILKEINELNECLKYINLFPLFYKLLIYINEKIWDNTNIIKSMNVNDENFSNISNEIFNLNQQRFRIKNWFNLITESNLKEQKSYETCKIYLIINNIDTFYIKIPEIYNLLLEYDNIIIISNFNDTIKNKIIVPTIIYQDFCETIDYSEKIILENYEIDLSIKDLNIYLSIFK